MVCTVRSSYCFPATSIDEILDIAIRHKNKSKLPSPRGVADFPGDFASAATAACGTPPSSKNKKVAGSAVECLEYANSAGDATTPAVVVTPFPNKQEAHNAISQCATRFLHHVLLKTLGLVQYCYRMTIHPNDVAQALELFVKVDAEDLWYCSFPTGKIAEDDMMSETREEEDGENEDVMWQDADAGAQTGEQVEDDTLHYDSDSDREYDNDEEDDVYIDENEYNLDNKQAPNFDAAYPPLADEIQQLSNEQFRKQMLEPIMQHKFRCHLEGAEGKGVDGMLKNAMYAFLVAKLS